MDLREDRHKAPWLRLLRAALRKKVRSGEPQCVSTYRTVRPILNTECFGLHYSISSVATTRLLGSGYRDSRFRVPNSRFLLPNCDLHNRGGAVCVTDVFRGAPVRVGRCDVAAGAGGGRAPDGPPSND